MTACFIRASLFLPLLLAGLTIPGHLVPSNHFVNGSEVTSLQHRESAVMKPIRSHAFSKTTRSVPLQPRPYRQSPPPSKEISQVERHPSTATTGDAAASCNLDTLLREGVSERARLKIKNTREINEFVSTVYEKRKEAFRRCSAGEKDRCESPDHPVWETLGISEPEPLPPPEPFHISPGCDDAAEDTDTETRQQISSTTPTTARIKRVNVLAHSPSGSIDAVPSIERHSRRVVKKEGIDLSTVSVDDLLPHSQPRADSGSREPHQPEDNGGKNGDGRGRHALTSVAGEHIPAKRTVGDTRITQIAPPSHREDQGTPKNESPDTGTGVVEADGSAEQTAFAQVNARIFNLLTNLFGNGLDISNPQNFEGGNQGSYFDFMYPQSTDYPWACVCDESRYKQWEAGEIDAVPCRNQVDMSAQGITAACNPKNHKMNSGASSYFATSHGWLLFVAMTSFLICRVSVA